MSMVLDFPPKQKTFSNKNRLCIILAWDNSFIYPVRLIQPVTRFSWGLKLLWDSHWSWTCTDPFAALRPYLPSKSKTKSGLLSVQTLLPHWFHSQKKQKDKSLPWTQILLITREVIVSRNGLFIFATSSGLLPPKQSQRCYQSFMFALAHVQAANTQCERQ